MLQRYDLKKMLEEIRAEEGGADPISRKLSQDDIKALLLKKKNAPAAVNP